MKLYYDTYRRLMNAIKKYCTMKGIKKHNARNFRQVVIYKHFIGKFGSFIAVNSHGDKQLFWKKRTNSEDKSSRKEFTSFMEGSNQHSKNPNYAYRSKDKSLYDGGQQAQENNRYISC